MHHARLAAAARPAHVPPGPRRRCCFASPLLLSLSSLQRCLKIRRSCRARLEAHNLRQEWWTAASSGSRRRPRDDTDGLQGCSEPHAVAVAAAQSQAAQQQMPLLQQHQHQQMPQLHHQGYVAAPADQARAALAALWGMPPLVAPLVTPGQVGLKCRPSGCESRLHCPSILCK